MAIATTRPSGWDRSESQRRVSHPLERLRRYIRTYVSLEGLTVLAIYLALWLWIGLLLDYGFFKAFGVDWVQELPHGFRVGVLGLLVAGLLAVVAGKVLFRLFREFRNPALALVLERRFPQRLGDRLITAVEMADTGLAKQYGYSQAMIDQTIRDAADRVEQVPVGRVFNWKRLWLYGSLAAVLWLGPYLLTAAGYGAYHYAKFRTAGLGEFVPRFNDVAAIWVERNILLIDTIWPRKAQLELLNPEFSPGDEMKVGRDAPPPTLRVRAWKWVVADKDRTKAPEGWRPLTWGDLTPDLLGGDRPSLPAGWLARDEDGSRLNVDEIELNLDKPEVKANMDGDTLVALRQTLARLQEQADSPPMSRRLRRLTVPDEITVTLRGETLRSSQTLQKHEDNEYSGTLSELKESVHFTVRGEDYVTPTKKITVVPPPDLVELLLDEDQPAYLYQRPPRGGEAKELRGLKQKFRNRAITLAGDKSTIDVPAGTDVVLTGRTDKFLSMPDGVRFIPQKGVPDIAAPIELVDGRTFRTRFPNLTEPRDMVFEFTDTDNVTGRRHVIIKAVPDQPPEAEVLIEVLRKNNQGYYLCTPWALVPFSGKIRDDHGLSDVQYAFSLSRVDAQAGVKEKAALAANVVPFGPGGWARNLTALALWDGFSNAPEDEEKPESRVRLDTFDRVLKDRQREEVLLPDLLKTLDETPPSAQEVNRRLLKEHNLEDPDFDTFDVSTLEIAVTDEKQIQPHYKLRIRVLATDNNVETGPLVSQRKEKFTILIISEEELLAEIGKEEENLRTKLQDAVEGLKDARVKLDGVTKELLAPDFKTEDFSPKTRQAEDFDEVIVKGWNVAREVQGDYRRILKELKANDGKTDRGGLVSKMIVKVDTKICQPLEAAIDPEFPAADESMRDFQKTLEGKHKDAQAADRAREQLNKVIDRLSGVLENMADIEGINVLIKRLIAIRDAEDAEYQRLQKLKKEKEDILLGPQEDPDKPKK